MQDGEEVNKGEVAYFVLKLRPLVHFCFALKITRLKKEFWSDPRLILLTHKNWASPGRQIPRIIYEQRKDCQQWCHEKWLHETPQTIKKSKPCRWKKCKGCPQCGGKPLKAKPQALVAGWGKVMPLTPAAMKKICEGLWHHPTSIAYEKLDAALRLAIADFRFELGEEILASGNM